MRKIINLIFVFLISCTFLVSATYASWAHEFVVYNGDIYVISESYVDSKQTGKKIGNVTRYSDKEGTYSGNFSNKFPKGTEYYEIKGITTKEAIAIKENKESFVKAEYDGKYAGSKVDNLKNFILISFGIALLFGIIYLFRKRRGKQ